MNAMDILIAGSSGFASECFGMLKDLMTRDASLRFKGFLAPDNQLQRYGLEKYYLGDEKDYVFGNDDHVIIGIGHPPLRKKVFEDLERRGAKFFNLISFYSLIPPDIKIGRGNVIGPYCTLASKVKIGDGNSINSYSSMGHDAEIGNFSVINSYCNLTGFSKVGDLDLLGPGVIMMPKAQVGNNCKVAAGSVVYHKFKDGLIIFGNPASKTGDVVD